MIRLWIALFLCFCGPALGQAVRVTSGEHDGFTRLVFDFGHLVDWQVGRNLDGYELRLAGQLPRYDLTEAFTLIGKSRLASIWLEPASGNLHIGLACACHAVPFEFRPGIVVVDLKDGPPPPGSSFELALDGAKTSPLNAPTAIRPKRRPGTQAEPTPPTSASSERYNWTADAYFAIRNPDPRPTPSQIAEPAPAVLPPDPGLQPLRDTLVHQMARGASQGMIEMVDPGARQLEIPESDFPSAQIRIGDAPTSVNKVDRSVDGNLGAEGALCIPPEALDIASWGDETLPLIDQMASARSGLSGEFDKPDPDSVIRAVRFQLFLGFGAEARQTLQGFNLPHEDAPVWRALSRLLDDTSDPYGTFKGQSACAGPAAMWALLDDASLVAGDPIDKGAIRLALSALPLHLRRQIGPKLSEKFLALGDDDSARALRDAITRAPGDAGGAIEILEASMDLHNGEASNAEDKAAGILADPGPNQPEALIALTEARIAQHLPIAADVALSLQAYLTERAGTDLEPRLQDALILAEAASGNFADAFNGLETHPYRQEDVWSLLAALAEDDVFLTYAVLDPNVARPKLQDETVTSIARRLTGLGLPFPAQKWLTGIKGVDPILLAETALKRGDGRAALTALAMIKGEVSEALKLQAFELLGEERQRANSLSAAGDLMAASSAMARTGEWEALAHSGDIPWKTLAAQLPDTPAIIQLGFGDMPYGPLAQGHDLASAATETRDAIAALLAAVPAPIPAPPIVDKGTDIVPTN